jgi:glutaredoxin
MDFVPVELNLGRTSAPAIHCSGSVDASGRISRSVLGDRYPVDRLHAAAANQRVPVASAGTSRRCRSPRGVRPRSCPHCAKAEEFLARLGQERPGLSIVIRDVQKEAAALDRLQELARAQATGAPRGPAFTLSMGLRDGFSPCSMWVLLLISLLAPMNDRPACWRLQTPSCG